MFTKLSSQTVVPRMLVSHFWVGSLWPLKSVMRLHPWCRYLWVLRQCESGERRIELACSLLDNFLKYKPMINKHSFSRYETSILGTLDLWPQCFKVTVVRRPPGSTYCSGARSRGSSNSSRIHPDLCHHRPGWMGNHLVTATSRHTAKMGSFQKENRNSSYDITQ